MKISFNKPSISIELCNSMIVKAIKKAEQLEIGISITIVDESGVTKAFSRMERPIDIC